MLDLMLEKNASGDYDLALVNGDFQWVSDGAQVAQHALIRMRIFREESELHPDFGIRFYEIIFNPSIGQMEKEFEVKKCILGTAGAKSIPEFNWSQEGSSINVTGTVQTEFGNWPFEIEVELT
jgi:hypothetical protein